MENQIEFQDQENLLEKLRTNQQNANFQQRLQALNLEIDPKNPEGKLGQSVVNGINAVPIIKDFFALNDN